MKRIIPLRFKVIAGTIFLVALLSGMVFYLTAIRFHRLMEGAQAVEYSKRVEAAAELWDRGMSVSVKLPGYT